GADETARGEQRRRLRGNRVVDRGVERVVGVDEPLRRRFDLRGREQQRHVGRVELGDRRRRALVDLLELARQRVEARDDADVQRVRPVCEDRRVFADLEGEADEVRVEDDDTVEDGITDLDALARAEHRTGTAGLQVFGAGTERRDERNGQDGDQAGNTRHQRWSEAGVKGFGSRASSVQRVTRPAPSIETTVIPGANSASACRQIPQGGVASGASVATATAVNSRCPATTAAPRATRSAQVPAGYDAFSTLQPSTMLPSAQSSAAPTWN